MKRIVLIPLAAAAVATAAACSHSASPQQRVMATFSAIGYPASPGTQLAKDQVAAAKAACNILRAGVSRKAAIADLAPDFYGDKAKTTSFLDAAIAAYCPGY